MQANAGNGTEHGEKSKLKKLKLTITECHKNCQVSVARYLKQYNTKTNIIIVALTP